MKTENLKEERDILRFRWHSIRDARLALKRNLSGSGKTVIEIRHNREYRRLKKEQRALSRMIRHIEKKIHFPADEKEK